MIFSSTSDLQSSAWEGFCSHIHTCGRRMAGAEQRYSSIAPLMWYRLLSSGLGHNSRPTFRCISVAFYISLGGGCEPGQQTSALPATRGPRLHPRNPLSACQATTGTLPLPFRRWNSIPQACSRLCRSWSLPPRSCGAMLPLGLTRSLQLLTQSITQINGARLQVNALESRSCCKQKSATTSKISTLSMRFCATSAERNSCCFRVTYNDILMKGCSNGCLPV